MRAAGDSEERVTPGVLPLRERLWFWPGMLGASYLLVAVAVLGLSYQSEMAKIDRGTFSDTVSPYFWLNVLTCPVGNLHGIFSPYPDAFNASQFRDHVQAAVTPGLVNILLQTALLVLLTLFVLLRRRNPEAGRSTD